MLPEGLPQQGHQLLQLQHAATDSTDLMQSEGSSSVRCQVQGGLQAAGCLAAWVSSMVQLDPCATQGWWTDAGPRIHHKVSPSKSQLRNEGAVTHAWLRMRLPLVFFKPEPAPVGRTGSSLGGAAQKQSKPQHNRPLGQCLAELGPNEHKALPSCS